MSKYLLVLICCALSQAVAGQSIASLNFRHLYDPQNEVELQLKLVHRADQMTVYYDLRQNGEPASDNYNITFSRYDSYVSKESTPLNDIDATKVSGSINFPVPDKPWILAAHVAARQGGRSWTYTQFIDPKYPLNGYFTDGPSIVFKPYLILGKEYTIQGSGSGKPLHIFFYKTEFSAAAPPYANQANVDRFMFADSTFTVSSGDKLTFRTKGLYLAQEDTASNQGFAFITRNSSYPRLSRIEDIPDPLIFVSAREEHDELLAAGNDKTKVDKVILDITHDKDRAKNFMRSYFRKVELSDLYFSSYKEGWKTDRGMMYLIFGLPDEVSRTGPNEVWYYKNYKERFTFVRSGSVYDPGNVTLVRSSKFAELWYSTVDLWRKSQF